MLDESLQEVRGHVTHKVLEFDDLLQVARRNLVMERTLAVLNVDYLASLFRVVEIDVEVKRFLRFRYTVCFWRSAAT